MMPVQCVTIFWVVNASSGEKSCLQFSIPTWSGAGGKGGVPHRLKTGLTSSQNFWPTSLENDLAKQKKSKAHAIAIPLLLYFSFFVPSFRLLKNWVEPFRLCLSRNGGS